MASYVVIARERTRNAAQMEQSKKLAPASVPQHPATFPAIPGRHEALEGLAIEEITILEFPTYHEAKSCYHRPEYQAASEHRFEGSDYCSIITGGIAAK